MSPRLEVPGWRPTTHAQARSSAARWRLRPGPDPAARTRDGHHARAPAPADGARTPQPSLSFRRWPPLPGPVPRDQLEPTRAAYLPEVRPRLRIRRRPLCHRIAVEKSTAEINRRNQPRWCHCAAAGTEGPPAAHEPPGGGVISPWQPGPSALAERDPGAHEMSRSGGAAAVRHERPEVRSKGPPAARSGALAPPPARGRSPGARALPGFASVSDL